MPTVAEVFARARRLQGAERARCLDADCGSDAALRAEVESLLAELDGAPIVDTHAVARKIHDAAARARNGGDPATPLPERIGPFRIVRVLGEGGMGTVYEAEQMATVKRRVALKVIKRGMDSSEVLARFDMERQALSVMDHPHVARVLDVGATDDGRPWFAMELVDGVPFTVYCDRERLSTHERLALFRDACQAVQHAHQKGVIHRDLKPTNILVAQRDGRAEVKVIDFGVAKAVGEALTDNPHETKAGHVLGTPAYMSPEQAEGSRLDVDTRTDVYSLGVILYELLAGRLPFDGESTSMREWLERLASGRTTPSAPSARVTSLQGGEATAVADSRRVTQRALAKELRGDLDWIVLRAMHPDRDLRYESAGGLAADVQRHLENEPVEARPPALAYRLSKFVRRHRAGVAAGVALALIVATLTVALAWQSLRLRQQRDAAREAEAGAERVSDFLVELFKLSDPTTQRPEEITAQELLDRGTRRIQIELTDQPLLRARMLSVLGGVNESLGLYAKAEPLLREALELRRQHQGSRPADVGMSLNHLGELLMAKGDLRAARPLYEELIAIDRASPDLAPADLAMDLNNLGSLLHQMGDLQGARHLLEEALAIQRATLGSEAADVAATLNNLGRLLQDMGELAAAKLALEESVAISRKALGPEHPNLAWPLANLGALLQVMGDLQGARPMLEEALSIRRKALGPQHPDVAMDMMALGKLLMGMGDHEGARVLLEESLAIERSALGSEHPRVATTLDSLGALHMDLGDMPAARHEFEESLAIRRKVLGPEHPDVAESLRTLGTLLMKTGDVQGARSDLEEALAISRKTLGPESGTLISTVATLGVLLRDSGDLKAARPLLEESLASFRKVLGNDHPIVARSLSHLGLLYWLSHDLPAAESIFRELVATSERVNGVGHESTKQARKMLADVLRAEGHAAEADILVRQNEATPS